MPKGVIGYGAVDGMSRLYVIDAVMEFEEVEVEFSEDQLVKYDDMVCDVCAEIERNGFVIEREWQSEKSYSYYIEFPVTEEDSVRIRFRISNHRKKNRGGDNVGVKLVFKTFLFGGKWYRDPLSLVNGVEAFCEAIKRGDFSAAMEVSPYRGEE